MKVLVAEDDTTSRMMLVAMIKKMGYQVFDAEDGAAALKMYDAEEPQIVITDWMMPTMDGLELCRQIRRRQRARYVYVIIVSVKKGTWSYLEGMEAGADDYVTKPVNPEELAAKFKAAQRILDTRK